MNMKILIFATILALAAFVLPLTLGVEFAEAGYDYPFLAYISAAGGILFVVCGVKLVRAFVRRLR